VPNTVPTLTSDSNACGVNPNQSVGQTLSFNSSLFSKVQNPIDKYLKLLKPTNGLNVEELLNFIKVCLQLKDEMQVSSCLILELCLSYANGPLLGKVIEIKNKKSSLDDLHKELLNCFIPLNLRDNLKRDFVNRPQRESEPLSLYISDIRLHANLLMCNYTESELVSCIKLGINPKDRCKLTFVSEPKTFADLEFICVQANNVEYNDYVRSNQRTSNRRVANNVSMVDNRNYVQNRPVCFKCQKVGHIAKFCRSNSSNVNPHPKNL